MMSGRLILTLVLALLAPAAMGEVELAALQEGNWDAFAPSGKEVDAIYGDFVLRNEHVVAVIGYPDRYRWANMTTRDSGGCIIDLTTREQQSDQLQCFYPGDRRFLFAFDGVEVDGAAIEVTNLANLSARGASITFKLVCPAKGDNPQYDLRYTLESDSRYVRVETVFSNPGAAALEVQMIDSMRHDDSRDQAAVQKVDNGQQAQVWTYDKWFQHGYGVTPLDGVTLSMHREERWSALMQITYAQDSAETITLEPGNELVFARAFYPGRDLLAIRAAHAAITGESWGTTTVRVVDEAGADVAGADVDLVSGEETIGYGVTDEQGAIALHVPPGRDGLMVKVSALGHGESSVALESGGDAQTITLPTPGYVEANVRVDGGGPTPCKVQFLGRDGTEDPFFGPDSGEHAVRNVYYSHDGSFRQKLDPGNYDVIISYGPEFDAEVRQISVGRGATARVNASLRRTVQTAGWVSAEFHSHSTPSGDNASSQRGRVLNLLAEHIEFAPCTEHNRIDTYAPHLEALNAAALMATCSGMELTSSPGSINHHNAFPLVHKPRTQDGGAPRTSNDPEEQIKRLALWDDNSEKLVQQNHPDIGWMFFDKDRDGQRDDGYVEMPGMMDVIEIHPPAAMFRAPFDAIDAGGDLANKARNRMFEWVQTMNQGFRVPGVVNTDAHANFHGSGWLRNYLKSSTDDPAKIDTMEMVRAAERGNIIMTNGPFLEVTMEAGGNSATAGEDIAAADGKASLRIRVQCPNWFDVDRVQIFTNGRPDPELNFTRATHPDFFENGVVKFEQTIPLEFEGDTHVIAAAIGEQSALGLVVGPQHADDKPVAVANPIFVDVDGDGFKANGDDLGWPLPSKVED